MLGKVSGGMRLPVNQRSGASQTDFRDAASRHYNDGSFLLQHDRWPNADHLFGLAAECGLKAIMQAFGMKTTAVGVPRDTKYRVHIDKLWLEFHAFADRRVPSHYASRLPKENPFTDWSVDQRYYRRDAISKKDALAHRDAARRVLDVLENVKVDGL